MSQVLILLRKSILMFRRARAAVAITFAVPIVLIYLFGHVFGLYRKDTGPAGIPIAVVNLSPEPAAAKLVDALKAEKTFAVITTKKGPKGAELPLTEADVRAALHDNDYRFAVILPADMMRDDQLGLRLKFLSNPRNEIETQTVNGILQKTIFSSVPQLLGQSMQRRARHFLGDERYTQFNRSLASSVTSAFGGDPLKVQRQIEDGDLFAGIRHERQDRSATNPAEAAGTTSTATKDSTDANDVFSRIVKIDTEQVAGKDVKNPMAARLVGGYAIMFLLFAVSGSAATLFEERSAGVFQRLLSSPVRPAHVLWARFLFGIVLGVVQISALFIAGRVFFGLELAPHLPALSVMVVAAAAACSAFGILIAAVAPSATAANGIATFVVISMSAVGGAWFPVSFMPAGIQTLSKFTLVYWSVEGLTDVLWAGHSVTEVLPKVGILLAIAAVVMAASIWRFNRSKFFE